MSLQGYRKHWCSSISRTEAETGSRVLQHSFYTALKYMIIYVTGNASPATACHPFFVFVCLCCIAQIHIGAKGSVYKQHKALACSLRSVLPGHLEYPEQPQGSKYAHPERCPFLELSPNHLKDAAHYNL